MADLLPMAGPPPTADPLATPAASPSRSGGSPPALRVEGLRKRYEDGFTAVAGLDLEIPDGAFFGLLGPNGAGKTTLIGSVCNIVRPSAGTLSVFGHDHRSRQARRLLGLAAQDINVDRFLSIRQILVYHAGYHGIGRKAATRRADELLALFRLDEPTAGVDVELRSEIWRVVKGLNAAGTTVLLTTHYLEEAETLCDEIALLRAGRIVDRGSAASLRERYAARNISEVYDRVIKAEEVTP
ncbi:ABC transporter ATP-binding protein [Streptomyces canus]|uniref:ABC transporter ATP-binding protein n=1 Tax=Streptomyces canus TaxID=58343 RepID=UPI0027846934|nr:ABC transporter ATP-binding protein [Streptomyces canus]MDQ0766883.1 ABC-2 type transport system ATP-binding protein [Streptomyces canus]